MPLIHAIALSSAMRRLKYYNAQMANRKRSDEVRFYQPRSTRIYPWDEWFDGGTWEITAEDYDGNLSAFRARCYYMAREFEYRLSTTVKDGKLYLKAWAWDGSELGQLDQYGQPITPDRV